MRLNRSRSWQWHILCQYWALHSAHVDTWWSFALTASEWRWRSPVCSCSETSRLTLSACNSSLLLHTIQILRRHDGTSTCFPASQGTQRKQREAGDGAGSGEGSSGPSKLIFGAAESQAKS